MANPAELLHTQLSAWHHASAAASNARDCGTEESWTAHRRAVRHLDAISDLLEEMSQTTNVRVYKRELVTWTRIVFAYAGGWTGGGSGAVDQGALDHLENLATLLGAYVPTADPTKFEEVEQSLSTILELLGSEDAGLDASLIAHTRTLVEHVKWCIENYSEVGDFELEEALNRLEVRLFRIMRQNPNDHAWRAAWEGYKRPDRDPYRPQIAPRWAAPRAIDGA